MKLEEVSAFLQRTMFLAVSGCFFANNIVVEPQCLCTAVNLHVYQGQLPASLTKGRNRLCILFQMVCSISALRLLILVLSSWILHKPLGILSRQENSMFLYSAQMCAQELCWCAEGPLAPVSEVNLDFHCLIQTPSSFFNKPPATSAL